MVRRLAGTFSDWIGSDNVHTVAPFTGSEDFGEYGSTPDKIPICTYRLGAVDAEKLKESQQTGIPLPATHGSKWAPVPEPTIKTGVTTMTAAVLELAGSPSPA